MKKVSFSETSCYDERMTLHTTEIELRYKIVDPEYTLQSLAQKGVALRKSVQIVDKWYVPSSVHSQADQDRWYDDTLGVAYRIRKTIDSDKSDPSITLDSKQLIRPNDHSTFNESIIMSGDEPTAEKYLAGLDYYNWLTIDKVRHYFAYSDESVEIVMDTVLGVRESLGVDTVLEIEYKGVAGEADALSKIRDVARSLNLSDWQLFDKSLTVESMKVLAKFR